MKLCYSSEELQVSVPLRGLWFLSRTLGIAKYLDSVLKFPSPYGDYGSYLDKRWYNKTAKWFPSPYGDYGSYLSRLKQNGINGLMFPSPYGDYGSYLSGTGIKSYLCSSGFRPLTGIMVLILRTLYKCLYEAFEMAFCGADHIFSSFFVFCKKMIFKKSFGPEF